MASEIKVTRRPKPVHKWFTTCPQQWFILVVKGEDLNKVIHSVDGWYVDRNFEFQPENRARGIIRTYTPIRAVTGQDFVGIPGIHGMYIYKFAWNKFWRETKGGIETPEYTVQAHEEENVFITPFEAQYPLQYGGIEVLSSREDENNPNKKEEALIPITLTVTVRVRMRRPKIALMTNTDWFGQVLTPQIQKSAKDFSGHRVYDDMIRKAKNQVSQEFSGEFMGSATRQAILDEAGVEIINISITDIKPNQAFEDALLRQAITEREAQAAVAKAEGEKKVKILQGEAEKEYQRLVGEGNAARTMAEVEAELRRIEQTTLKAAGGPGKDASMIEKWRLVRGSGVTTYVEGNPSANAAILVGSDGRPIG